MFRCLPRLCASSINRQVRAPNSGAISKYPKGFIFYTHIGIPDCNSVQAKYHQLLIWKNSHWPSHEGHFTSSAERNFFVLGFIASGVSPSEYRLTGWSTSKMLPFILRHVHTRHLRSKPLPFSCTNIGSLGTQPIQLWFRYCTSHVRFHCTARFLCVVIFH